MRILRDPVVLVTAVVVVVGVLVALIWATRSSGGADFDRPGGQPAALEDVTDLPEMAGRTVVADRAEVLGVPADEGFWVATGDDRAWVELAAAGESPVRIAVGDRVSFTGEVVRHDADFADRADLSTSDAAELAAAGAHIEVDADDLTR